MNTPGTTSPLTPSNPSTLREKWRQLFQGKRVAYLTLPLLIMATIVEFVIVATGWKYQQTVCLPQGMGVTLFGIGPIGATILAVELLKLPLAIWTASRTGWAKGFMLCIGLPLVCLLTFQLVKDMAVYEMTTAMKPASEYLEKAATEEIKISQLNGELAAIEAKKTERQHKLSELSGKHAKAKTDIEESLKHNEATRLDAISLTDYQRKELSEVEARQASITKQFDADAAQLTKTIADLRTRREVEVGRASKWNAEEARIENEYKSKLAAYTNRKNAYLKDKAEYDNANILKRQLMREPVDPGVPPVREANTILKPVEIAELDAQIKDKETELLAIHNKRRDAVAQVASDARRVREEFDRRSSTKREETDRKRDELLAALALATTQWAAEEKLVNEEYQAAAAKVDGIRAELDAARKRAEGFYEAREAAIRNTQVHRIATTVEIVRGLIFGERPMSITATARERGDILTDQISMVRIWVYPVLAFIVAFLPTLLVEIGFSTVFKPDQQQRPQHRLGFLGRRMHWLYTRAGRLKILRAERIAREASDEIAARDRALANEKTTAEQALAAKEIELQAAHEAAAAAAAEHEVQLKQKEDEWVAKFAGIADSLNKSVAEKDALRALQNVEIERQVQQRQNAWADRVNELSKELDTRRDAAEAERKGLIQEHHKKLQEVTETAKSQIAQARRLAAETELASQEKTSKLEFALKEALDARDAAIADSRQQIEALSLKLAQAREDGARELEKASRQEKHRLELNQLEVAKQLRLREEEFEREQQKREQELAATFEARLIEEQAKTAQAARRRDDELERQLEARVRENDARWRQEIQRIEADAVSRLDAREQQLQAQTEVRIGDIQSQAEQELRRQQSEFERQFEARDREADARLRQELQQREIAFHSKLKQRELELNTRAAARETELQSQWAADFRARQEEWEKQAEARVRAAEARLNQDSQQKEELFQMKLRQREQQLQSQFDARQAELQAQRDQDIHNRQQEWERNAQDAARAVEQRWMADLQQKEELFQSKLRQRDQQWQARLDAVRAESQAQSEEALLRQETESGEARQRALRELEVRVRKEMQEKHDAAFAEAAQHEQNLVAQLAGQAEAQRIAERERDEALQSAVETAGQMKELKEKLLAASTLLAGWKGGNGGGHDGNGFGNGNGRHLVLAGSGRNS